MLIFHTLQMSFPLPVMVFLVCCFLVIRYDWPKVETDDFLMVYRNLQTNYLTLSFLQCHPINI
uniref:Uncharacterized protein n=1 Tax=Arundo donax TaxID=35708 RepID=A0A0A8Y841_ARUDO